MTILIATDGSQEIYSASRLLAALVRRESVSRVVLLTVTWPPHDAPIWNEVTMRWVLVDDLHHAVTLVATESMEKIKAELAPLDVPVESIVKAGDPAEKILEVAREYDVDLIVIGRHPQRASDNSVSERILANARCPVLVGSPSAIGCDARVHRDVAEFKEAK